jgi:predicted metal-dependent HD superfamily phosphohydrolase
MYQLLEPHLPSAQNPDALLIALFYHDAVYNPRRTNNELKSANLLSRRLVAIRQPESFIETAMGLILATQTHDARGDHDTALFLDADLAILGSAHPEYVQYAEAIRKEFSMFPDWIYRPARTKVLQRFLARSAIFLSPVFYPQFEATARQNLEWEIGQLHHG